MARPSSANWLRKEVGVTHAEYLVDGPVPDAVVQQVVTQAALWQVAVELTGDLLGEVTRVLDQCPRAQGRARHQDCAVEQLGNWITEDCTTVLLRGMCNVTHMPGNK